MLTTSRQQTIEIVPIGWARSPRDTPGYHGWGEVVSEIHIDSARFGPSALIGLEEFSHLEVIFFFDRIPVEQIAVGALHPRGRPELPQVGIFATRQKERTNRLGVSRCRLLKIDGLVLHVQGLDVLDHTPVVDIKPYLVEFDAQGDVRQPQWITALMADYYHEPR